jgi:hypothetical protein
VYTVSELAQKHEAGVTEETTDPKQAYAGTGEITTGPYRGGLPGD